MGKTLDAMLDQVPPEERVRIAERAAQLLSVQLQGTKLRFMQAVGETTSPSLAREIVS
jgi:hypothetical protein